MADNHRALNKVGGLQLARMFSAVLKVSLTEQKRLVVLIIRMEALEHEAHRSKMLDKVEQGSHLLQPSGSVHRLPKGCPTSCDASRPKLSAVLRSQHKIVPALLVQKRTTSLPSLLAGGTCLMRPMNSISAPTPDSRVAHSMMGKRDRSCGTT